MRKGAMTIARADWPQLLSLLETALDLPEPARQAWLSQLDGPAPLIEELRRLLEDRRAIETGEFLQVLPSLPDEPAMSSVATGSTRTEHVGPYRLVREIGRGGMSTVWLAERADQQLKRQVALKLPHTGPGQDSLATRLLREREILSGLDHPHIARLFDVGITETGTPYLVMEYVEGERLLDYADQHQLDIRQRIALFRQVLSAVQHAHTKLLLHRDLKPSNILVNRAGEVKLLDFGIAKLVSNDSQAAEVTELTRAAGQPLTLMYASPEQLRGEALTTACDVYALGVVLYELLCGQHPVELKSNSAARAEDAVLHQEPRAPSRRVFSDEALAARSTSEKALRRMLCGDLDAIVLRALAKAPADRFGSVDAFSADIGRWAAGEPVQARAPSAWYYLGKFMGRNRVGVGLGIAAICALLAASAVALVQGRLATQEAARATAAKDFLLAMFKDADPDLSRGKEATAQALLRSGHQRATSVLAQTPELQAELLMGIGQAQADIGDRTGAGETIAQAINTYERLKDDRQLLLALLAHADITLALRRYDEAQTLLSKADALAGPYMRDPIVTSRLSQIQGFVAMFQSDWPVAKTAFERYVVQAKTLADTSPSALIEVLAGLANTTSKGSGDYAGAMTQIDQAFQIGREHPSLPAYVRMDVVDYRQSIEYDWGRYADIRNSSAQDMRECDDALGPGSDRCLRLRTRLQKALLKMGMASQALALNADLSSLLSPLSPGDQALAIMDLARSLALGGQLAARPDIPLQLRQIGLSGEENPLSASYKLRALNTLAEVHLLADQPTNALTWVARAHELASHAKLGQSREAERTQLFEGIALSMQGHHSRALTSMARFCSAPERPAGMSRVADHLLSLNCAAPLAALGQPEAAVAVVKRALPVLREGMGPNAPTVERAQRWLDRLSPPGAVPPSDKPFPEGVFS
jgi:eukaryotic-like serine/threonine-protein kinase